MMKRPRQTQLLSVQVLILTLLTLGAMLWPSVPSSRAAEPAVTPEEETLVVTATRLIEALSGIPTVVQVISAEDIASVQATGAGEALRLAPNLAVATRGPLGAATAVSLRGSAASQVLILVNGRPVDAAQGTATGGVDLADILLDDVERIEIVKGPFSSLYGANALGGVVNFITKSPWEADADSPIATGGPLLLEDVSVSGGSSRFGSAKVGAVGNIPSYGGIYRVTLSGQRSNGYLPNSEFGSTLWTGRHDMPMSTGGVLSVSLRHLSAEKGIPGSLSYSTPRAHQDDDKLTADMAYTGPFSDDGEVSGHLYLSDYRIHYTDPDDAWAPDSRHHDRTTGLDLQASRTLGVHRLLAGMAYRLDWAESTKLDATREANNLAVFAEDRLSVNDRLDLSFGSRLDRHSVYGSVLSPRAGIVYRTANEARLFGSVGRAFRAPSFDELYWKPDGMGAGNPDLLPEQSWALEAGVDRPLKVASGSGSFQATIFYKEMEDNIVWQETAPFFWQPMNVRESRVPGVEIAWNREYPGGLGLSAGYTWMDPRDADSGQRLLNLSQWSASTALSYRYPSGTKLLVNARAQGDRLVTRWPGFATLDGFLVMDLRLSRQFGAYEVLLAVDNLLDTEYQEWPDYPSPRRTMRAGVTQRF